jgi:hypothetical protein
MSELLEIVLQLILEVLLDTLDLWDYWRFGLCAGAALCLDLMIDVALPYRAIGTALCVLATVLGVGMGIWWQFKRD